MYDCWGFGRALLGGDILPSGYARGLGVSSLYCKNWSYHPLAIQITPIVFFVLLAAFYFKLLVP